MSARIRAARPGDAAGIARVHVESWRATYEGLLPEDYLTGMRARGLAERWHKRLRLRSEDRVWVAVEGGEVLGFALAGPCADDDAHAGFAGEVQMLYVHPEHLRQGLGGALFVRALETLAAEPYFWLAVWVVERNYDARSFYERMGLRLDGGRRTDRFLGRMVPVVRYAKPLNPLVDYDRFFHQLATDPVLR